MLLKLKGKRRNVKCEHCTTLGPVGIAGLKIGIAGEMELLPA